jgi:hypothetical protein
VGDAVDGDAVGRDRRCGTPATRGGTNPVDRVARVCATRNPAYELRFAS